MIGRWKIAYTRSPVFCSSISFSTSSPSSTYTPPHYHSFSLSSSAFACSRSCCCSCIFHPYRLFLFRCCRKLVRRNDVALIRYTNHISNAHPRNATLDDPSPSQSSSASRITERQRPLSTLAVLSYSCRALEIHTTAPVSDPPHLAIIFTPKRACTSSQIAIHKARTADHLPEAICAGHDSIVAAAGRKNSISL